MRLGALADILATPERGETEPVVAAPSATPTSTPATIQVDRPYRQRMYRRRVIRRSALHKQYLENTQRIAAMRAKKRGRDR